VGPVRRELPDNPALFIHSAGYTHPTGSLYIIGSLDTARSTHSTGPLHIAGSFLQYRFLSHCKVHTLQVTYRFLTQCRLHTLYRFLIHYRFLFTVQVLYTLQDPYTTGYTQGPHTLQVLHTLYRFLIHYRIFLQCRFLTHCTVHTLQATHRFLTNCRLHTL
jgi:hypothetical protein